MVLKIQNEWDFASFISARQCYSIYHPTVEDVFASGFGSSMDLVLEALAHNKMLENF